MLSYLDKFNSLAPELRDSISSEAALAAIEAIENKYGVSLASVIMRVMVQEISIIDLPKYFVFEFGMDGKTAETLTEELKQNVFLGVADYLGFAVSEAEVASDPEKYETWAKNERKEADVSSSNFFFSSEDEDEVRELAKKVETFAPAKEQTRQIDEDNEQKVDKICRELKISFSSDELNNRFRKVLSTYIKGVRSKVDTVQTLIKSIDDGGLSMDSIYADNILLVADKVGENFVASGSAAPTQAKTSPSPIASGLRDAEYDFSQLTKKAADIKKEAEPVVEEKIPETTQEKVAVVPTDNREEIIDLSKLEERAAEIAKGEEMKIEPSPAVNNEPSQTETVEMPINMAVKRATSENERGKVEDVKYKPKLTGPVEELSELDLVNFRRLNADPKVAADKIKEKIKILEKDSYAKRLSGIKSWRQSPMNKLYLAIGQESMLKRQNIDEIIAAKKNSGEEVLTAEEFETIMQLNKALKY
jgi:hypothetical protein